MPMWQKIKCSVSECIHNEEKECYCNLDQIQVTPMTNLTNTVNKDQTSCASYKIKDSHSPKN